MGKLFEIIAVPFGYVMQFCYFIAQGNYVVALLLFSFLIEIVMLPFAVKQQKNSIKAASLKPKEMAIRKKYGGHNDQPTQQKMMMEIQEMQKREGYSPFGGCLQLLIQFPILIALYNIVYNPFKYITGLSTETIQGIINKTAELNGVEASALTGITVERNINLIAEVEKHGVEAYADVAGFLDKVPTVDSLPDMKVFGLDLGEIPSFEHLSWVLLIPLLTFAAYFFSSKLNRKFMYQPS